MFLCYYVYRAYIFFFSVLLAGHFCSPGCPEHCVPACWRDGIAKGFIGKKSVIQQTIECKQTHSSCLPLSLFIICCHLSFTCPVRKLCVSSNWIPDTLRCVWKRKGWARCLSCCCCLMLFIRAAPVDLLEINSKALTHSTCVKLWKRISCSLFEKSYIEFLHKTLLNRCFIASLCSICLPP